MLFRSVAALRIAMGELATRDYIRSEIRDILQEQDDEREAQA